MIPYLEEEKTRFLFLEVPADVAGAAGATATAPLAISTVRAGASAARADASEERAGASAARAASVVDCLGAARPPQTMPLLPPEPAPVTGVQAPTYRGGTAP
jgi:hypothetical protein